MDSKSIFILWHIGLGDALLCNGLVRWYANLFKYVTIPCYQHNLQAVSFMFSDLKHVEIVPVRDSADAVLRSHGKNCLKLGYYADGPFDPKIFDQEFYRQAMVPFEERWKGFRLPNSGKIIDVVETDEFALVHHDPRRGFFLRIKSSLPEVFVEPTKPFFDWREEIQYAREIHCINSSFMILVDSLPEIEGKNLYFHHYVRPTDFPTLKKKWKILSKAPEKLSDDTLKTSQVYAR